MSTRAAIGVWESRIRGQWRGTYHHWDGYPSGLERALWKLHHDIYNGLLPAMVEMLIDAHPEGWSTIVGADWTQRPTWIHDTSEYYQTGKPLPPLCYQARGEAPMPLNQTSDVGCEWAYVFDLEQNSMSILVDVGRKVGDEWEVYWLEKASLPMLGSEPDWTIFE